MHTLLVPPWCRGAGGRRIIPTVLKCTLEARPAVLGIHLIRFAAGVAIGARLTGHLLAGNVAAGAAAWTLAIFSVYLFNGVMDVREDRVNGSRRPIASGVLPRRTAAYCVAGAAVLSVAAAAPEGPAVLCAVAAVLAIGWQYSARPGSLKGRPAGTAVAGTAVAGTAVAGTAVAGTAVAGAAMEFLAYFSGFASQAGQVGQVGATWRYPVSGPIAFAVIMSAWMALVGAPAKDLSDVPGDAAAGRRTLAVVWGERPTRRVVAGVALATATAFLAAAAYSPRLLAWPAAALAAGAIAITWLSLSRVSDGSRARRRLPYKGFMLTQYTTNICLLLVVMNWDPHRG